MDANTGRKKDELLSSLMEMRKVAEYKLDFVPCKQFQAFLKKLESGSQCFSPLSGCILWVLAGEGEDQSQ